MMTWLFLALGLVLLVAGADILVKGAARLAASFGIPSLVIGLTVVAFGTSAPELAVSVKAAYAGEAELAIANVVGSNIFNILCVLGLSGLVSPTPLLAGEQMSQIDIPVMLAVAALCVPLFFAGAILNRIEGALFLTLYVAYTWFLVAMALQKPYLQQLQEGILYGLVPLVIAYVLVSLAWDFRKKRQTA